METPRIYVGTYAKYNNGSIEGKWFDLDDYSDKTEFYEAITEFHNDEDDPEFMFQDWENIPDSFIDESCINENFWDYLNADIDNKEAFEIFVRHQGYDLEDFESCLSNFEDSYRGEYSSTLDFASELFDELYLHEVPESIRYYIDYEKFERDLFMGDYWEEDGYIFCTF